MNDGENLDVDSLVRSLNQIAEKENDEIIAHVDKLYDKTVTLASPRLMKESNLDFYCIKAGTTENTKWTCSVLLTKSSPTPISSSISTEEMTLADVSICLDDLVTQVEKVREAERDKVQHETLLLYCKRLQHQQLGI